MKMNKRGEGGELWLLLIFLALIPMCTHAGDNSYKSCLDNCENVIFYSERDENFNKHFYFNSSEVKKSFVDEYCYIECKPYYSEAKASASNEGN